MADIKIVLVGGGGVGKSALTITYVSNIWVPEYDPTIEDNHRKQVCIDDTVSMLDILDTAGQEEFSSMQSQWFRAGQCFLCVYAINSKKSFGEIQTLREKILRVQDVSGSESGGAWKVAMVLVGNKSDLPDEEREVTKAEGQEVASSWGEHVQFFETSARNHVNVDEAFRELVRGFRKAQDRQKQEAKKTGGGGKNVSGSRGGADAGPKEKRCTLL
eukprot:TRINITY_DN3605_c0_g1_i1.p1 TRINITY_DN3605_c0_g1~~TRINITY_DN3605_c0_g1_i1.p1  ORF type:complete len:216 (-),score=48.21 TRINITY_DN3605_c0_g1_i1:160-807(-)